MRRTHRPAHDRLHRRDPPLQQGAAGRVPAARRGRRHRADRRDHREPVVRGERRAAVALEGLRAARADDRRGRGDPAPRADRHRARPRRRAGVDRRRCAARDRALRERRRAVGAEPARAERRRPRRRSIGAGTSTSAASSRRSSSARCSTTSPARSTTTSSRRCTSRCATAIPTRRSTGWRGWSRPARIRSTSRGGWCASRRRTSATPIRRR